jgi:hypothetical protein
LGTPLEYIAADDLLTSSAYAGKSDLSYCFDLIN